MPPVCRMSLTGRSSNFANVPMSASYPLTSRSSERRVRVLCWRCRLPGMLQDLWAASSPNETFEPGAADTLPQRQKISQDFPEADISGFTICHADAAPRSTVSEAQEVTFAKSRDLTAKWRSYAASALERADLRCQCSHRSSSKGRDAEELSFRCGCTNGCFDDAGKSIRARKTHSRA